MVKHLRAGIIIIIIIISGDGRGECSIFLNGVYVHRNNNNNNIMNNTTGVKGVKVLYR